MVAAFESKHELSKEILRDIILSDRTLQPGQKQQALNFLNYTSGNGRGKQAKDPIHKTSGVQIAVNYLNFIKGDREWVKEVSDRVGKRKYRVGGKRNRSQGTKHTLTPLRKRTKSSDAIAQHHTPMPHPNTVITNTGIEFRGDSGKRLTLRQQVLELLGEEIHRDGLTLGDIALHFPDRTKHGIKSCLNKAVSNGHLKYNLKSKVYYL